MEETFKEKSYRIKQNAIFRILYAINVELESVAKELGLGRSDLSLHYDEKMTEVKNERGDVVPFKKQIIDIKINL